VIPRRYLPEELLQLAARQAGALSLGQLEGFDINGRVVERMVAQGILSRITRGVYATESRDWHQLAWAGVLIGGPRSVLGRHSAAFLQGLVTQPPERIDIFTGTQHRQRDGRWHLNRAGRLGSGEPPRTRLAQTVLDVTAVMTTDESVAVLAEAIGRRRVRPRELEHLLAESARHPHRQLLGDLVAEVAAGALSPLEARYARDVERAHGLPEARRQAGPLGRYRCDAWYESFGLIVELDGKAYHRGASAITDMDRDNAHLLVGVRTLRFGWRQVTGDPCRVAAQVAGALANLGWTGGPRRCPRCPVPNR